MKKSASVEIFCIFLPFSHKCMRSIFSLFPYIFNTYLSEPKNFYICICFLLIFITIFFSFFTQLNRSSPNIGIPVSAIKDIRNVYSMHFMTDVCPYNRTVRAVRRR